MILYVYQLGKFVGVIEQEHGKTHTFSFTYDASYLACADALPLSISLPLRAAPYDYSAAVPFFDGLLPEGRAVKVMEKVAHVVRSNIFGMLRELGSDCAGSVSVMTEPIAPQPERIDAYLMLEADFFAKLLEPTARAERVRLSVDHRLSLAGAQDKICLYADRLNGDDHPRLGQADSPVFDLHDAAKRQWGVSCEGAPSSHILKPESLEFPGLVVNEFLCMRLAAAAGIPVAEVAIVEFEQPALSIRRFDRELVCGLLDRIPQEDSCQALQYYAEKKYEIDGGPSVWEVADLIRQNVEIAEPALSEFLRLLIFNYLIGNCDAHGKNVSFIRTEESGITLAPAYDLVSTTYWPILSHTMGMSIGNIYDIDRVDAQAWRDQALQIAVNPRLITQLAQELIPRLIDALPAIIEMTVAAGFEEAEWMGEHLRDEILRRSATFALGI
jgi:serine/threonine-protein kinase HipA